MKNLFALFFVCLVGSIFAQTTKDQDLVDIDIKFEYHYNQVFLTATEGCNWLQLQFNFFPHEDAKLVDNMGVSTYSVELYEKLKAERTFLFILKRTETGFKIEGLQGVGWEESSFDCAENYCKWRITEEYISLYTD